MRVLEEPRVFRGAEIGEIVQVAVGGGEGQSRERG